MPSDMTYKLECRRLDCGVDDMISDTISDLIWVLSRGDSVWLP